MRIKTRVVFLCAAFAFVILGSLAAFDLFEDYHDADLRVYRKSGNALLDGQVPYRDFFVEYPPLALAAFVLPHWAAGGALDRAAYPRAFGFEMALWAMLAGIATALSAARGSFSRRPWEAFAIHVGLLGVFFLLWPWRYDLFPVALTGIAFLCALRRQDALAGIFLGWAGAAKLYPFLLVPLFIAFAAFRDGRRGALAAAGGVALAAGFVFVPAALLAPGDWTSFLDYHWQRGLQVESLSGGLFMALHVLAQKGAPVVWTSGAHHLNAPAADLVARALAFLSPAAVLAALGAGILRMRRENANKEEALAAASALVLCTFIITGKVFSPQFLLWLLPFVPLLRGRTVALYAVIGALSILVFPVLYTRLLTTDPLPVILLNLRNALMLLLSWLTLRYRPRVRPSLQGGSS